MNPFVKVIVGLISVFVSLSVFAKNQPDNPWTDCGLGYALFKNSEIGAAISNVIWDAGTTATTTFVSSPDSCRSRSAKVAQFIGESYDSLESETAAGYGPNLTALMEVASCSSEVHGEMISAIRTSFANEAQQASFENMPRVEKAEKYFNVVSAQINTTYKEQCAIS